MLMKFWVFVCSVMAVSVTIGWGAAVIFSDRDSSFAIGMGVGMLSFLTILSYANLWFADPMGMVNPPEPRSERERQQAMKTESKLQIAERQMGIAFAFVGVNAVGLADGPIWAIAAISAVCGIVGGLIGFDLKRRILRLRAKYAAHKERNKI